jgi:hypothetical protein
MNSSNSLIIRSMRDNCSNQTIAIANDKSKALGKQDDEGCRVCRKDNDHANLLLCEMCNDEYHTYCLDPPLNAVPKGDFYCGTIDYLTLSCLIFYRTAQSIRYPLICSSCPTDGISCKKNVAPETVNISVMASKILLRLFLHHSLLVSVRSCGLRVAPVSAFGLLVFMIPV